MRGQVGGSPTGIDAVAIQSSHKLQYTNISEPGYKLTSEIGKRRLPYEYLYGFWKTN